MNRVRDSVDCSTVRHAYSIWRHSWNDDTLLSLVYQIIHMGTDAKLSTTARNLENINMPFSRVSC